jgi:nitrite reductase/ring-hydroxylating ferredoxin subunit
MTTKPKPSRLDPEPTPRRDFLGLSAMAAAGAALLFGLLGMLRLPKAAVLPSLSKKFKLTLPETLAPGRAYVPPGRSVAVFQDTEGVYAVSLVCTHLGCIVKPTAAGFECPCHGSRFGRDGSVTKGPAPKPLPWLNVSVASNSVTVDEDAVVPQGTKKVVVA